MTSHAVRIHQQGAPDVLQYEEVHVGDPGPGEVRLQQKAIGLNFIETQFRSGVMSLSQLPVILGSEAAGIVDAVGEGVTAFHVGDRVAYGGGMMGAYAQSRIAGTNRLIKLPEEISEETAAAIMLKGLTAQYLLRQTYRVSSEDTVLFHAAAGGVGLIACQWMAHLGATVIGTVGSEEKAELARVHGCHHTINYNEVNFVDGVKEITDGRGVDVVYDSVGLTTFEKSLDCLRPRGLMVLFGTASGPVKDINPNVLVQKGSLYLTRTASNAYNKSYGELIASANELFGLVNSGVLAVNIGNRYSLSEAAEAHMQLETRRTMGSSILLP